MKAGFKISGVGPLRKKFADKRRKASDSSVAVGYTANYAIYVHEMVDAVFKRPGAQAKFLEEPARRMEKELLGIIEKAIDKGATIEEALFIAGLRLQRASQEICPVDTGNLRASAFTRKE